MTSKQVMTWSQSVRMAVVLCGTVPALSGCAWLNTRPGHPDSYAGTEYYVAAYKPPGSWHDKTQKFDVPSADASSTPVFAIAKTPAEIWKARSYARDVALRYQAAAYKAQDRQDELAIPLFGTAIGTAAAAIAHVSTVGIAAIGLGGGAAGLGYSYLHPDKDAAADQSAEAALFCVVDQTHILTDMSAVPLALDKAALQDAVQNLLAKSGGVTNNTAPSGAAAKKALQAVLDSADQTIQALNAAIAQYVMLPSEIYLQADTIDETTKASSVHTIGSYQSLVSSLQTAATNQAMTDAAKTSLQSANGTIAQAPAGGSATAALAPAPAPLNANTNLASAKSQVQAGTVAGTALVAQATAPENGAAAPSASTSPAADTQTDSKNTELNALFEDGTLSAMTRVTALGKIATNDIPEPNFSTIAANIKACALPK